MTVDRRDIENAVLKATSVRKSRPDVAGWLLSRDRDFLSKCEAAFGK